MKITKFDDDIILGEVDDRVVYLRKPCWDCDWYWGFGYLGNYNCHYHIDGLDKNKNLYDAIKEHFGDSLTIKDDKKLWLFCELISTFYSLKETAEVLGRGGSNYGENPLADIIKNKTEVDRINNEIMPKIFDAIWDIFRN
jgi:hypothetical protein